MFLDVEKLGIRDAHVGYNCGAPKAVAALDGDGKPSAVEEVLEMMERGEGPKLLAIFF